MSHPRLLRALSLVLQNRNRFCERGSRNFGLICGNRIDFSFSSSFSTSSSRWKPRDSDPLFSSVWRQFQKKVHPDLLSEVPELRDKNAKALQELQGVLNDIKTISPGVDGSSGAAKERSSLLTARTISLEFFVRAERQQKENGSQQPQTSNKLHFLRVPFVVRIPGPNCQRVLAEALGVMFGHCGLSTRFKWGNEYFGSVWVENKVMED